ncbi:HAD family hydrolase [Nonomuraea sp. NPDC050328]|uniref:HAD family hydrolase n=1 Tax=Nonomuraea sp. NPDC050328 TaxID=3364361 RepID=UPI0037B52FEE
MGRVPPAAYGRLEGGDRHQRACGQPTRQDPPDRPDRRGRRGRRLRRSGLEGVRKPDPRLFELAAQRCGGGWMVGDDLTADIQGAAAAGLRTIWVDHGSSVGDACWRARRQPFQLAISPSHCVKVSYCPSCPTAAYVQMRMRPLTMDDYETSSEVARQRVQGSPRRCSCE